MSESIPYIQTHNIFAAEDALIYYDKDAPTAMYHLEFTYDRKYVVMTVVKDTSRVSCKVDCRASTYRLPPEKPSLDRRV